jgi:CRISPR system Cascade subunit CasB
MTSPFSAGHPARAALLTWWHGLQNHRGDRAELRRCATLLQVVQTPAFHVARQRLVAAGFDEAASRRSRLAAVVGLAASIAAADAKSTLPLSFSEGEKPAVSPLRFRQILEAGSDEELFMRLRRVLPLVDGRVNLPALAADVWHWGDAVKKRWVYDYRWPDRQTA